MVQLIKLHQLNGVQFSLKSMSLLNQFENFNDLSNEDKQFFIQFCMLIEFPHNFESFEKDYTFLRNHYMSLQ
jgi:hypothetical protein